MTERIAPDLRYKIKKIRETRDKENNKTVDKYLKENDISDLVSPYMYDPVQKNLLNHILGTRNANDMVALNTLTYSGIINTSCPPPGEPDRTEEYINLLTGKKECREPVPDRQPLDDASRNLTCPQPGGDPLAIEKYIDYWGKAHCSRPVLSGSFSCPPRSDPGKTKRIALKNGVGICVEDPKLQSNKDKVLMPTTLVFPDKVNANLVKFLGIYNNNRFKTDMVNYLSQLFKSYPRLKDLQVVVGSEGLSGMPEFTQIKMVVDAMNKDEDIGIAHSALAKYAQETGIIGDNINELAAFQAIDFGAMLGGRPRRHYS